MKLATLRDGSRDGALLVVRRDHGAYAPARDIARTLQDALDRWDECAPALEALSAALNSGATEGEPMGALMSPESRAEDGRGALAAPLPRAYEWIDGSAYIHHILLVRRARGAAPPPTLESEPLVYQGGSGVLLGPHDDIVSLDRDWGLDFEAEVCVVLGDTPQGTPADRAGEHVRLLMLCNDITLRHLIPPELAKGFGFFTSKPASAFSPLAVTPDELGSAWRDGRLHLPLKTMLNGALIGEPNAGPDMHFSFYDLIAHITRTRSFTAGTVLGSGTVASPDRGVGSSCLAERRTIEILDTGAASSPFLRDGDRVAIEMFGSDGRSVFGAIEQQVVEA
ncbi:MAG: fumarylacetoacetate hydrolase family protein [Haliangiales bacterium]